MPRKNLTEERSAQILQAFERCIARYGIEGSTLEKVAEEAVMKRTIIRHYIGNRNTLIAAVADNLILRLSERLQDLEKADLKSCEKLTRYLFQHYTKGSFVDVLLIEQFIAASTTYPQQAKKMVEYVEAFTISLTHKLHILNKKIEKKRCWNIAYGITSILFNEASIQPLKLGAKYTNASKHCVKILIQSLES